MNPIVDVPIALPVNLNPMLGHIDGGQLHVLGVLLVLGFVVACCVIGWKILHTSRQPTIERHAAVQRRDFDQAA